MSIQFLDSRISEHRNDSSGTELVPATPSTLFGDIGLQTAAAVGTPNESNVRIELWGTIGVNGGAPNSVTVYVQRGGSAVFGSGVIIYVGTEDLKDGPGNQIISFHAVDFPPAIFVANREIRYTMFVAKTGAPDVILQGPVSFSGIAQAGTTTS
ncbi:hypothetical protein [Paenibacillus rigui]|uniref:Uncharacterized protein n=1 Tax=Paenibacillus rigui TaxID=554312 RepID=A0A229UPF3_9BACL|nr:hypothetical protein [Paenibacillus rigui]OXM85095.1 hypothetical protein CF651_15910 [Paenibacillus rigui]